MENGVVFRFIIYSVNGKGRSEPFILDGITFRGGMELSLSFSSKININSFYMVHILISLSYFIPVAKLTGMYDLLFFSLPSKTGNGLIELYKCQ